MASAQDTDLEARYSALLQQIADTKMVIAQKEAYIGSQQAQIDSLSSQIEFVPGIKESVRPIVTQMTAEIEKVIKNDLPFLADERYARLDDLKADLADATIGESVLYRKAMTLYDIETNYGNTVGSYTGNNPVNPRSRLQACQESLSTTACAFTEDLTAVLNSGATLENLANEGDLNDGNYIHFGRLAFLYLQVDSSEGFRYDKESQSWEPLSQGEILGVRRSVRIARGESAAGVLTAPILVDPAP
ncbi:MAG: DUF3450 family protein [Litorimonas sp.]